jgi:hypothetical protein
VSSNPSLRADNALLKIPRREIIKDEHQKTSDESDKSHYSGRHRPNHNDLHLGPGEVDRRPTAVRARHNLHVYPDRLPRCSVMDQGILGTAMTWRLAFIIALWIWTECWFYTWVRIPPSAPVSPVLTGH